MYKYLAMSVGVLALVVGLWHAGGTPTSYAADSCGDFTNQASAQSYLRLHLTNANNLDSDHDGIACESLPCPCDHVAVYYNGYYYNGVYVPNTYTPDPAVYLGGPAPSRTGLFSLATQSTEVKCGETMGVVARVMYPDGSGAVAHMVTFTATAGTVYSELLSDGGGYAPTRFVAPLSAGKVEITAFSDGMSRSATVNVTCPAPLMPPPLGITYVYPPTGFLPPNTGEAGLAERDDASVRNLLAAAVLFLAAMPVGALLLARQRQ